MPLNSLVVFLFFTLSPNKLFHGDTLSPNILKLLFFIRFQKMSVQAGSRTLLTSLSEVMRVGMKKSQHTFAVRRKVLELWRKPNCEEMKVPTTFLIRNQNRDNTQFVAVAAAGMISLVSISAEEAAAEENIEVVVDTNAEEKAAKAEAARVEIEKAVAAAEAKVEAEKAAALEAAALEAAAIEAARLAAEETLAIEAAKKAAEAAAAAEAARLEAEAALARESWEKCKIAALVVFISWLVFLKTSS